MRTCLVPIGFVLPLPPPTSALANVRCRAAFKGPAPFLKRTHVHMHLSDRCGWPFAAFQVPQSAPFLQFSYMDDISDPADDCVCALT